MPTTSLVKYLCKIMHIYIYIYGNLELKEKEKTKIVHIVKVTLHCFFFSFWLEVSIYRSSCLGLLDLLPYSLFFVQPFPYVRKVVVWIMGNLSHLLGLGFNGGILEELRIGGELNEIKGREGGIWGLTKWLG